jgi:chromosome partitioning protein
MTHIIATAMQKGGVGKTTSTLAVGCELAQTSSRVLLIDLDPQSNLTQALGCDPTQIAASIYEVLLDPQRDPAFATRHTDHGVDLIPATLALAGAELSFAARIGREVLLRQALAAAAPRYDYILIDTPPTLGLLTVNALVAATTVLVPLQAHVFALKAMTQLEESIALVRQLNPALCIGGIVITMLDRRTTVNGLVEATARDTYGDLVFTTVIPLNVKLVEAPAAGLPIARYAAHSTGAAAYAALAQEVRGRWPLNTN